MTDERPRPRAFRLDDESVLVADDLTGQSAPFQRVVIAAAPDVFAPPEDDVLPGGEVAVEIAQKKGLLHSTLLSWGGLFWSALGGLISLGTGLWVTRLIDDLFARSAVLGWTGMGLAGLIVLALLVLALRELRAIFRLRHSASLHIALAEARLKDDRDGARKHIRALAGLYQHRPQTARARGLMMDLSRDIIDGRDLIDIAERNLMAPLDQAAQRAIATAAKRVSMVTALSPKAIVDVVFVAAQALRLIRQIAEIYGGRPGLLGIMRLTRSVGAHIAITGGVALGDSLIQQVVGHGLAARLSARLGEGVLNGMLTARIGLSAMAVCRPMPYAAISPPAVRDVAPFLFSEDKDSAGKR